MQEVFRTAYTYACCSAGREETWGDPCGIMVNGVEATVVGVLKAILAFYEAQQRWRLHGNRGTQSLPGGKLGTTLRLRVAFCFPRRNEVCGNNSPPSWQEPGFSGESARFLRNRTCGD